MSSTGIARRLSRVAVVAVASSVVLVTGVGSAFAATTTPPDHSAGNAGTSGTATSPQPLSTADMNTGGANGDCITDPTSIYCSTRDGSASGNGNQATGQHTGEPCAACEGNADNKNPSGQEQSNPLTTGNNGYECDNNNGIGQTNPAHSGCPLTLTNTCLSAASGGGVTWTLANGNAFDVTADWTSGAQTGTVTVPAATAVTNTTSTPGTATFTTTGTSVKVTFPANSGFAEIDQTATCAPPPGTPQLQPLTLTGDCASNTTPTWTLTNPNATDVTAHWATTSPVDSGDVVVPAGKTATFTTTATSVTVTFPGTTLAALPTGSIGACPPPPPPPGTCSETLLFDALPASGSTVQPGDTISVIYRDETTIGTGAFAPVLTIDGVAQPAGSLTVSPTAGSQNDTKLKFVIPASLGDGGTHTLSITAFDTDQNKPGGDCDTATWTLEVSPPPPPGTCSETVLFDAVPASGSTVKPGDTISAVFRDETAIGSGAFAPVLTIDGVAQPAGSLTLTPLTGTQHDTLLSYVIPASFGDGATHTFQITAFDTDQNKPGGDCGTANWTLKVTPTQTVSGLINICSTGDMAPSTGSLLTVESTSVSSVNPLAATPVAAGDQTVDAVAPSGFHFVDCNQPTQQILTPTTAKETVNVPVGGTNQAVFFVEQNSGAQTPPLTLTVVKTNDADADGVFHDTETASAPAKDVPFLVQIVNGSTVPLVIDSVVDAFATTTANECAGLIGTTLAPGASTSCTFTLAAYSPAAGDSLPDTVTVVGHQEGNPANTTSAHDSSTVLTPAAPPSPGAPDLAIVKTASAASVAVGDTLSYGLAVTNVGGGATTGPVTVTDTVPTGLSLGNVSGTDWTCNAVGRDITCTFDGGPIAAGQTVDTITVVTTVLASAPALLTNTGVVKTPGDTNATNDTSTVKTPVTKVLGEKIPQTPTTTPTTPTTPATPTVSPNVLPMTGTGATALLPGAMGMLAAGLLLLVSARRRRRVAGCA